MLRGERLSSSRRLRLRPPEGKERRDLHLPWQLSVAKCKLSFVCFALGMQLHTAAERLQQGKACLSVRGRISSESFLHVGWAASSDHPFHATGSFHWKANFPPIWEEAEVIPTLSRILDHIFPKSPSILKCWCSHSLPAGLERERQNMPFVHKLKNKIK